MEHSALYYQNHYVLCQYIMVFWTEGRVDIWPATFGNGPQKFCDVWRKWDLVKGAESIIHVSLTKSGDATRSRLMLPWSWWGRNIILFSQLLGDEVTISSALNIPRLQRKVGRPALLVGTPALRSIHSMGDLSILWAIYPFYGKFAAAQFPSCLWHIEHLYLWFALLVLMITRTQSITRVRSLCLWIRRKLPPELMASAHGAHFSHDGTANSWVTARQDRLKLECNLKLSAAEGQRALKDVGVSFEPTPAVILISAPDKLSSHLCTVLVARISCLAFGATYLTLGFQRSTPFRTIKKSHFTGIGYVTAWSSRNERRGYKRGSRNCPKQCGEYVCWTAWFMVVPLAVAGGRQFRSVELPRPPRIPVEQSCRNFRDFYSYKPWAGRCWHLTDLPLNPSSCIAISPRTAKMYFNWLEKASSRHAAAFP